MKKILKGILYLIAGVVLLVVSMAITLWANSPGTTSPITDSKGEVINGSIASIEKIELGGIEQYLIIRGADSTKPVMLYLHGGPGSPEIAFLKKTNIALEKDFVMVYWEQRGAGKSYNDKIPAESMNLEQMIADTKELSELLIKRFGKEKIYLLGHSWGTFLGIKTAYKYPELYHAYLGAGQVCHQYKAEQISFEWIKEQAKLKNDEEVIKKLEELQFPDSTGNILGWKDYMMAQRNYVNIYGGGMTRELTSMWPVVKMVLGADEYTFGEKMSFMSGSLFSLEHLWLEVIHHNLFNEIDSMQVPTYIFQGKYDYQTPTSLSKDFYEQLKAPKKDFYLFENSAHSPNMEEIEKFNGIIREIVGENLEL